MNHTLTIHHAGKVFTLDAQTGDSLYALLAANGFALDAPCGGKHKCKKCLISASGALDAPSAAEKTFLPDTSSRLACFVQILGDATVRLPETFAMRISTEGYAQQPLVAQADAFGAGALGVAFDIGTTTVASFLYDLSDGRRLAVKASVNPQRRFGADVISRITHCMEQADGLAQLQDTLAQLLNELIDQLVNDAGVSRQSVVRVSVAGNTVMGHLLHGLDPKGLAAIPFSAKTLFGSTVPAAVVKLSLCDSAQVYTLPGIASYVGGDITAGLLAVQAHQAEKPFLFVDVGTNGEIAFGDKTQMWCCATAAGPAFEGADITCGMAGVDGAICAVRREQNELVYDTIGSKPAKGLCGSGLIDALAVCLDIGLVDETGRLLDADEVDGDIAHLLVETADAQPAVRIAEDIVLTAGDIRKLQLGKAAIAGGIATVLAQAEAQMESVSNFFIAGGFGSFINIDSACRIGLFPAKLRSVMRVVGNTAAEGAILALVQDEQSAIEAIRDACLYVELSTSPDFMENYVNNMMFL